MKTIGLISLFAVLATCTGCSTRTQTTTTQANAQPSPQATATPQTTPTASAQPSPAAAAALVTELYAQHDKGLSPFFQTEDRARVDKFFEKRTADLIWKDAVEVNGEVGALGADPLYDAQDTDIKNLAIGQARLQNGRAEVPVTFENFGKKQNLTFTLVAADGAWKISDIRYPGSYSLLKMLEDEASVKSETVK